jgi:hypothetical protein
MKRTSGGDFAFRLSKTFLVVTFFFKRDKGKTPHSTELGEAVAAGHDLVVRSCVSHGKNCACLDKLDHYVLHASCCYS